MVRRNPKDIKIGLNLTWNATPMAARYQHPVFLSQALCTRVKPLLDLENSSQAWTGLASPKCQVWQVAWTDKTQPYGASAYEEELLKSQYIYTYIHHIAKIPMQRTSARPHALAAGTSHPTPQGRHWLRKKPAHIHQKPMLDMSQS